MFDRRIGHLQFCDIYIYLYIVSYKVKVALCTHLYVYLEVYQKKHKYSTHLESSLNMCFPLR